MRKRSLLVSAAAVCIPLSGRSVCGQASPQSSHSVGIFEGNTDIGKTLHAGAATYNSEGKTYTVSGSGENMWFAADAFQFVWKKVSGDVALTAGISFPNSGGNEHRKAVLMVRQDLDAGSAYADVALHGNGLTSLQFRGDKGGITHEIQANISGPKRLRIEKRGDYVYMWLAGDGGKLEPSGAAMRLPLNGEYYVGIGVCSHDKDTIEKAMFSDVSVDAVNVPSNAPMTLYSTLETIGITSTDRRVVYVAPEHFEAPNWMRDGLAFLFNRDGRIYRLPTTGGKPELVDTEFANRCNNDHGISPDSTLLAISDQSQEEHRSIIYLVPIGGSTPRRITQNSPSYWHGWSPDGENIGVRGRARWGIRHLHNSRSRWR